MKHTGSPEYRHDTPACTGILITNLGTPDAPTTAAVRRYLAEFLSDPRVIETSRWLWLPILHGVILRTRPRRTAGAYGKIWGEQGSPLLAITHRQAVALQEQLDESVPGPVRVEAAMRYGNPSIASALEKLRRDNIRRLLVLPLYPQYSAATTASTFDAVSAVLRKWRWLPELRFVNHYHDDAEYIEALVESVHFYWSHHSRPDRLLFSFHGLPKKYFLAGDPYFCECHKTARLVAGLLDLNDDEWAVSFQSRFGPTEWLQPYTDKLLQKWGGQGIGHVQVICPGFSADCLETLEEIEIRNRELFMDAGGREFSYIPSLNDSPVHIHALTSLINRQCRDWPEWSADWNRENMEQELQQTARRAGALSGNSRR